MSTLAISVCYNQLVNSEYIQVVKSYGYFNTWWVVMPTCVLIFCKNILVSNGVDKCKNNIIPHNHTGITTL